MIKAVALMVFAPLQLEAQTLTLHDFTGMPSDGARPTAGLTSYGDVLYGTTSWGGISNYGTLFMMSTNGAGHTVLAHFVGTNGESPHAGLTLSGNTLYGTTQLGGLGSGGTVFKINTNGDGFTVLRSVFGSDDTGWNVPAGLVLSGSTLYGTTSQGGISNWGCGTVFKMNADGTGYTELLNFDCRSGGFPPAGLVVSGSTLYGVTEHGGISSGGTPPFDGFGTLFKVNTNGTGYTVLKNFTGSDGARPNASLTLHGNTLYGTTIIGGSSNFGTLFKMNTNGTGYTVLKNFIGTDGKFPYAGLTFSGNTLYGTTHSGGDSNLGTVFMVNTNGMNYKMIKNFTGSDGANPFASLILLGGSLYGTTTYGGSNNGGVVFRLTFAPAITSQPQSQMAVLTSNAIFTVSAVGMPPFSYQWYFNSTKTRAGAMAQIFNGFVFGAVVTNSGSGYTIVPQVQFIGGGGNGAGGTAVVSNGMVSAITMTNAGSGYTDPPSVLIDPPNGLLIGQTSTNLYLNAITTNSVGDYFIVITNSYGSITSSVASLTIAYPPSLTQQPVNQTVSSSADANFSVTTTGTQPWSYQWWMVASQQTNATAVPMVTNGFVLAATITSGGAGYLSVPKVLFVGGSGSGAAGTAIVSNRMVTAINMSNPGSGYTTPPVIQIGAPTAIRLSGQTNSVLSLAAVTDANVGNYYVVVTNSFGSVTSSNAFLTVILSPILALQLTAGFPQLNLYGVVSSNFVVQYSTNSLDTNWIHLLSLTNLSVSPYQFLDPAGVVPPSRFYRAFMH